MAMNSRFSRWLVAASGSLAVFVLMWGTIEWIRAPAPDPSLFRPIHKIECAFSPPGTATWQSCPIPHNWDTYKPDYSGDAWYRLHLPENPEPSEPMALWLVASMNASVTVNGVFVGSGGRMSEPAARHWNHYLLFTLPDNLLRKPLNDVVIRVHGYANNSSGLLKLYYGPATSLAEAHYTLTMRSNLLTFGSLIVTMLIGLLASIAAIVGRNKTVACFALGCLCSLPYLLDTIVINIPVSRDVWERMAHISIITSEMFFIMFIFRVLDLHKRWLFIGLGLYGATGTLLIALASDARLIPSASVWEGLSLLMLVAASLTCLRLWLRNGLGIALTVTLALLAILISFMHDWLPWVMGQGVSPPFTFYLGPAGFVLAMASLLLSRLISDFRKTLKISLSLRDRVRHQQEDLSKTQASLLKLWSERMLRDERDRIVRELHDGVGGSLSSMLASRKTDDTTRRRLQDALNELRLVMSAIDEDADVVSLLGTLRQKLESETQAAGCTLQWDIEDVPSNMPDDPASAMHVTRIVQECVHNSLRHGAPGNIRLRMDQEQLLISDNGTGFDPAHASLGRGLKNIRWRAEQMGADLDIASDKSGTAIRLTWP